MEKQLCIKTTRIKTVPDSSEISLRDGWNVGRAKHLVCVLVCAWCRCAEARWVLFREARAHFVWIPLVGYTPLKSHGADPHPRPRSLLSRPRSPRVLPANGEEAGSFWAENLILVRRVLCRASAATAATSRILCPHPVTYGMLWLLKTILFICKLM